jgi:hypothetical protein
MTRSDIILEVAKIDEKSIGVIMHEEHPLIADLIANQPKEDVIPYHNRILHICGHKSDATIYGSYRMKDRWQFAEEHECPVCMMYRSARHCFGYSHNDFGKGKHTGFATLHAMINAMEMHDVSA